MIDISNELFTMLKQQAEANIEDVKVIGESQGTPSEFPTITFEEITNIPTHLDSAKLNKYARLNYRIQVFSNKKSGKRAEARAIYKVVDEFMQSVGFHATTFSTTPAFYLTDIYQITSTYEAVADSSGNIFRR